MTGGCFSHEKKKENFEGGVKGKEVGHKPKDLNLERITVCFTCFLRSYPLTLTINYFMDVNRLQKLAGAVRTGGKGSVRRFAQLHYHFISKRFLLFPSKEKKGFP